MCQKMEGKTIFFEAPETAQWLNLTDPDPPHLFYDRSTPLLANGSSRMMLSGARHELGDAVWSSKRSGPPRGDAAARGRQRESTAGGVQRATWSPS